MNTLAKIPLMIVSFLLSLVLWVYVQVLEKPTPEIKPSYMLKLTWKGLPDNLTVVDSPADITIFPRGALADRATIDERKLSAYIDLRGAVSKPNEQKYPVRVVAPSDLNVRWDPRPLTALVRIEQKTTKDVPVEVQAAGELSNPDYLYLPEATYTEPRTVTISGPAGEVEKVKSARAILDLGNPKFSPDRTYPSDITPLQDNFRQAPTTVTSEPSTVLVHPGIAIGLPFRFLHVVPRFKGAPPPGFSVAKVVIDPESVRVRGRGGSLRSLYFLSTQDIDLSSLKQTTTFAPNVLLPSDVIEAPPVPVTVKVVMEAKNPEAPTVPPKATNIRSRRRKGR